MNEMERFLSPHKTTNEVEHPVHMRPTSFSEYVGQKTVMKNIELMARSAKRRKEAMDHVLLSGPPGLGKTSLAMLVACDLGTSLHQISGPAIEKKGDIAAILTNLNSGDVLFIDEIHRMHISVEEILYSAMEDFRLDIVIGQGAAARTMQIDVAPFTLIGATTRTGLLSTPLRDRFVASLHFDFYEARDLEKIIGRNAHKLNIKIDNDALGLMASCARGTPRIANRILRRVRDFSLVNNYKTVSLKVVEESLKLMDIDGAGLDRMDRKILQVMRDYYSGGPVGIEALCATLSEDRSTVEDVYEPYLLKEGFIIRTPRGRELTERGLNHVNNYK